MKRECLPQPPHMLSFSIPMKLHEGIKPKNPRARKMFQYWHSLASEKSGCSRNMRSDRCCSSGYAICQTATRACKNERNILYVFI